MAQERIRRRWTDRLDGSQPVTSVGYLSHAIFWFGSVYLSLIYPFFFSADVSTRLNVRRVQSPGFCVSQAPVGSCWESESRHT